MVARNVASSSTIMKSIVVSLIVLFSAGVLTAHKFQQSQFDLKDSQPKANQHGTLEQKGKAQFGYRISNSETAASGYKEILLKITKACLYSKRLHRKSRRRSIINRCNRKLTKPAMLKRRKRSNLLKIPKHQFKKNNVMNDLPKPAKPLKIVAASSAIKSRLKGFKRPIKAIHIWGTTPFNVFINRLARLHKNVEQQRKAIGSMKRLFTPLEPSMLNHLAPYKQQQPLQNQGSVLQGQQKKVPFLKVPELKQQQYGNEENFQQQQRPITKELSKNPQDIPFSDYPSMNNYVHGLPLEQRNNPVPLVNDVPSFAFGETPNDDSPFSFNDIPYMPFVQKLNDDSASPPFVNGNPNLPMEYVKEFEGPGQPPAAEGFPYFMRFFGFPPDLGGRDESYEESLAPNSYPEGMQGRFHHYSHHAHAGTVN